MNDAPSLWYSNWHCSSCMQKRVLFDCQEFVDTKERQKEKGQSNKTTIIWIFAVFPLNM